MQRRNAHIVRVGNCRLGSEKIYIQSMLNRPCCDIQGNIKQAMELEKAGCDILRIAIPNTEAISLIKEIKNKISIPLVADIHFNYQLAIKAIEAGIDKIRINPGNIGSAEHLKTVTKLCKKRHIPIRVGVNAGSLEKAVIEKYPHISCTDAMVKSALYHISLLESFDFNDIVVSLKSSNVQQMVQAYQKIASLCPYPLHLGVTEAGTERTALIKSSIGIGSLLLQGIGDTIRVSITGDPNREIAAAQDILKSLGLFQGVEVISCPTCGRTSIDIIGLAQKVEEAVKEIRKPLTVAVMGCVVNGPGEAKNADIGIAGANGEGVLFKKGMITKRHIKESEILDVLITEIRTLI